MVHDRIYFKKRQFKRAYMENCFLGPEFPLELDNSGKS